MDGHSKSRRKALKVAVGALCTEVGFGIAEESAIETLTEMMQSCMYTVTHFRWKSQLHSAEAFIAGDKNIQST